MTAGPPEAGLTASLRRLFATLLEVAQVRLELLANELETEKLRIFDALVWAALAMIIGVTGLVLGFGFIVLLMPPELRALTMGSLVVVCLVAAALMIRLARRRLANPPGAVAATVDELRRDRAAFTADNQP